MFRNIIRGVHALQGTLALFVAAGIFLDPARIGAQLGLSPIGELGLATMRADLGSLFAGAGLFMLAAAVRGDRWFLIPPIVFTGIALAARAVSITQTGVEPELIQPIVVEAVTIAILFTGFALLSPASK